MRRAPLFVIVVTLVIVAGVGVALATTHDAGTSVSAPADAGADVAAPTDDVPPSQQTTKATPEAKAKAAAAKGEMDCRDDCGSSPSAEENDCTDDCGSPASGSASTVGVDDDRDGDGGDCGEGD